MNRLNETVKTDGQENIDNFVAQSFWLTKPVTFIGCMYMHLRGHLFYPFAMENIL